MLQATYNTFLNVLTIACVHWIFFILHNHIISTVWILQVAPKTYIPALFGHANDDKFIKPSHSDLIFKSYAVLNLFLRSLGYIPNKNSPFSLRVFYLCKGWQKYHKIWWRSQLLPTTVLLWFSIHILLQCPSSSQTYNGLFK